MYADWQLDVMGAWFDLIVYFGFPLFLVIGAIALAVDCFHRRKAR